MSTPAGWYPDPSGKPMQRYFDGTNWTENYAPYGAPVPQRASGAEANGEHLRNRKLALRLAAALAVLIVGTLAWVVASGNLHTLTARNDAGMGQHVSDGQFEFVVDSVYESGEATLPRARGTWMVVAMTVTNTGTQPQSFFMQNQKLIDTAGREYAADAMASYAINKDSTMVLDLGPGFAISARVPFDVPPGTTPEKVEVHDSAFSAGAVVKVELKN